MRRVGDVVADVAGVLRAGREVGRPLDRAAAGRRSERAAAVADVAAQRDALVYDGFVSGVGRTRLADLERYLRAMVVRLDKQPDAPGARSSARWPSVHRVQDALRRRCSTRWPAGAGAGRRTWSTSPG